MFGYSTCLSRYRLLLPSRPHQRGKTLYGTAAMLEPAGKIFSSALGAGFGYGGHTAWLRGFPDVARERMRVAIASATELKSPFEQAYTQWLAAKLQLFLRNFETSKDCRGRVSCSVRGARISALGRRSYILPWPRGSRRRAPDSAMPRINLGFRGMEETGR